MNREQVVAVLRDTRIKLDNGAVFSDNDVDQIQRVAEATERPEHIVLYTKAKFTYRNGSDKQTDEVPVDEPVVESQVDDAREMARLTGRIEDRAKYAVLKQKIQEQGRA